MKKIAAIFSLIYLFQFNLSICNAQIKLENADKSSLDVKYSSLKLGINLDHALTIDKDGVLASKYQSSDFEKIAKAGFKHVRLLVRDRLISDKHKELSKKDSILITKLLKSINKEGLIVIFNFSHPSKDHKRQLEKDVVARTEFLKFTRRICTILSKTDPDKVLIEPFNEPHFINAEIWYSFQNDIIKIVREELPKHTIIVSPVTESANEVVKMLPLKDDNLIYSVHFYLPLAFTHQDASWTWKYFPPGYHYPNKEWSIKELESNFFKPISDWAKLNHIKVYCGEFGVINKTDTVDKIKWLKDASSLFNLYEFPAAVYDYNDSPFSIANSSGLFLDEMVDVLYLH